MSMSTHVIGFITKENDTYKKQCAVLRACNNLDISELPHETAVYFGSSSPDLCLIDEKIEVEIPVSEYSGDYQEGYELKVSDIPEGVEVIRFYNSY